MDLHIIPECYVDTNLIETLVPTTKGFNHQKGCGTVAKVMKEKFPAIEKFILTAVEESQLDLANYDLPYDFNEFKKTSKSVNSKFDKRFKKLFKDIHASGNSEFTKLGSWVTYLKEKNYKVNIDELKEI